MFLANETVGSLRAGDEIGFDVDLHRTFGEIATYNGRKEPVVGGGEGGGGCCCGGGGGGGRHEKSGQETAVLCKHSGCRGAVGRRTRGSRIKYFRGEMATVPKNNSMK